MNKLLEDGKEQIPSFCCIQDYIVRYTFLHKSMLKGIRYIKYYCLRL